GPRRRCAAVEDHGARVGFGRGRGVGAVAALGAVGTLLAEQLTARQTQENGDQHDPGRDAHGLASPFGTWLEGPNGSVSACRTRKKGFRQMTAAGALAGWPRQGNPWVL